MSVTKIDTTSQLPAASELAAMMQGQVVSRGDDTYAHTPQIWNLAVENQPALFAVCETSADVQAAVLVARRYGIPFSVRGGGHHWAGLALCADGLVIEQDEASNRGPALTSRNRCRWSKGQGRGRRRSTANGRPRRAS